MAVAADVRQVREATVLEHIEAERRGDFDAALATFARPRYEFPGDEVIDGPEAVAEMYRDLATGFPDLDFPEIEAGSLTHHGDSVIGETRMMGTHEGSFRGLPPTGRRVDVPEIVIFDFDGSDLLCERVYFDRLTLFVQLGVARDPNTRAGRITTLLNHPLTLARGALRSLRSRWGGSSSLGRLVPLPICPIGANASFCSARQATERLSSLDALIGLEFSLHSSLGSLERLGPI